MINVLLSVIFHSNGFTKLTKCLRVTRAKLHSEKLSSRITLFLVHVSEIACQKSLILTLVKYKKNKNKLALVTIDHKMTKTIIKKKNDSPLSHAILFGYKGFKTFTKLLQHYHWHSTAMR